MPLTQTITIVLSDYWDVGQLGVGQLRNLDMAENFQFEKFYHADFIVDIKYEFVSALSLANTLQACSTKNVLGINLTRGSSIISW